MKENQVSQLLNKHLNEQDIDAFCRVIGDLIEETGERKVDVYKQIGISRPTLYHTFLSPKEELNPTLKTISATLDYLGYSLSVSKKTDVE